MWGRILAVVVAKEALDEIRKGKNLTDEQRDNNRRFVKFLFWLFGPLLLFAMVANGIEKAFGETFKNANGQVIGRSVTNNAGTTYYDASGRNTGRSTTNNTGTTYYDNMGRQVGRSTPK